MLPKDETAVVRIAGQNLRAGMWAIERDGKLYFKRFEEPAQDGDLVVLNDCNKGSIVHANLATPSTRRVKYNFEDRIANG